MTEKTMTKEQDVHQLYVDGALHAGTTRHELVSPATGDVVATMAWAGGEDARRALEAADRAAAPWARLGTSGRAQWIGKLREQVVAAEVELRRAVQDETGKPWEQTEEDHRLLVDSLDFYVSAMEDVTVQELFDRAGSHRHHLVREPIGVAVAFLAWNFPLLNLGYKLGPAMAAGCPIVVKPSAKTPLAASIVGRLCHEIGLPPGVVNIVFGDDAVVGDALSSSTIPALITLIGATDTARHVMTVGATSVKRYSLELGGNAPAIVYDDADLDLAAEVIASLKFGNAGQICVAPNRVLVHERVADELVERLVQRATAVRVGAGEPGSVEMGPLIDAGAARRVGGLVRRAVEAGARLVAGGGAPVDAPTDCYLEPTVLTGVRPEMDVSRQEIFGPVVALRTFGDEDDVVALGERHRRGSERIRVHP